MPHEESSHLFESPGVWWLPSNAPKEIPGLLRIDHRGELRIELFEALGDATADFAEGARHPVVHGRLHTSPLPGGTELTHFDAFDVRRSLRSNGTVAETLVANRSYVGDERLPDRGAKFSRFRAEIAGLREWIPGSAVRRSASGGVVRLDVNTPVKLSAALESGARIELVKAAAVSFSTNDTTVSQSADVACVLDEPRAADDVLHDVIVPLKFLVSLALGQPTRVDGFDIVLSEGAQPWPTELHDLGLWARAHSEPKPKDAHPYQFLIAGPPDDAHLQRLVHAWWGVFDRGRRAIALAFALWEAPPKFVELRFGSTADVMDRLLASLFPATGIEGVMGYFPERVRAVLPAPATIVDRWNRAREDLRSGRDHDARDLYALSEIGHWLMRLIILQAVGADLEPASRSPDLLYAASAFLKRE